MRQYTTPEQTAKLIDLGFEKPKNERWVLDVANESTPSIQNLVKRQDYSIGELLSFLPKYIKVNGLFFTLCVYQSSGYWVVEYDDIAFGAQARLCKDELIDALFAEIVMIKEEGIMPND